MQERSKNGDTWADIQVNQPLDYEDIKEYNLTIRVVVSDGGMKRVPPPPWVEGWVRVGFRLII